MKRLLLILALLTGLVMGNFPSPEAGEEAIQSPESTPQQWQTLENEYFVIRYHPEDEEDARETLDCAMWVREHAMEKYPHDLGIRVTIRLYESRAEIMAEKGVPTALSYTRKSGEFFQATIFIIQPSWRGHWGGYEQLDNPFRRVLNHEYVHVPFYRDLFMKTAGYKETPAWFHRGIAEYIVATNLFRYCATMTYGDKKTRFGGFYVPKFASHVRWISPKASK